MFSDRIFLVVAMFLGTLKIFKAYFTNLNLAATEGMISPIDHEVAVKERGRYNLSRRLVYRDSSVGL